MSLSRTAPSLTEALAEYWHARVRKEFAIASEDPADPAARYFSV